MFEQINALFQGFDQADDFLIFLIDDGENGFNVELFGGADFFISSAIREMVLAPAISGFRK